MLIEKYSDLLDEDDISFEETIARFLINNLKSKQRVALTFNDPKNLESFTKKESSKTVIMACHGHIEIINGKSSADKVYDILQKETAKKGYHIHDIFHGANYIIYEKSSIH